VPPAVRGAGPALLYWKRGFLSVGDAPEVTATPGANHLAVAVGSNGPEGPRDLADLEQSENQQLFAQTPIAVKPARVSSQECLDAIGVVHVLIIGANHPSANHPRMTVTRWPRPYDKRFSLLRNSERVIGPGLGRLQPNFLVTNTATKSVSATGTMSGQAEKRVSAIGHSQRFDGSMALSNGQVDQVLNGESRA